jgi:hypothetical protein
MLHEFQPDRVTPLARQMVEQCDVRRDQVQVRRKPPMPLLLEKLLRCRVQQSGQYQRPAVGCGKTRHNRVIRDDARG